MHSSSAPNWMRGRAIESAICLACRNGAREEISGIWAVFSSIAVAGDDAQQRIDIDRLAQFSGRPIASSHLPLHPQPTGLEITAGCGCALAKACVIPEQQLPARRRRSRLGASHLQYSFCPAYT
jgi:hypothetical protein